MNTHEPAVRPAPAAPAALAGLAIAALALALAPLTAAARPFWSDDVATGSRVDVQVQVQGHSAPLYLAGDARDRFYFQAFKGRNYALSLHNRTGQRIGVLIAVDGLNVVNGERTALTAGEPMYVLDPWETAVIRGWRTSLDEVRQFVFVDEERSYAERTGQANGDMGWIRVLSFRENRPLAWSDDIRRYRGDAPEAGQGGARKSAQAPSAERDNATRPELRAKEELAPGAPDNFPGTGWGERRGDPVRRVQFDPERNASDRLALRYEYESGLRALGIFPNRRHRLWEREHGQMGFAQPPKW
jgi:hypothetical protein